MNLIKYGFVLLCIFVNTQIFASSLVTDAIFSPTSFWYTPIPEKVELHENSAAMVQEFIKQKTRYYNNVTINTTQYASPVFYVDANVPTVKVTQWDCQKKGFLDKTLAKQWASVPMPEYAQAAEGRDAEMTVYQAFTDTLWEFWKARKVDGKWEACWGGAMQNASKNQGIFNTYYGTTATSLPFIGGQITAEELQRGEIKHAIGIALVNVEKYNTFSWPAHRSDGYNPHAEPNRIPEGLRFRLDPTIDVDSLKMHPVGKIIAKAAQKYGFVVWDKAGSVSLRAQNPFSYTSLGQPNPYDALFMGKRKYELLNNFPWDRLQFLPMNYGKPK